MSIKAKTKVRYYARDKDSLRNGSFYRRSKHGMGWFINGDFMGMIDPMDRDQRTEDLTEYKEEEAKQLIPSCCQ